MVEILSNLLNNAINYTQEHGEIGIDIEKNNEVYSIGIWDNGSGIQKEDFYALFQPYSRIFRENFNESGTGLGLYYTKQLVESLHGIIKVQSEPNVGSRFLVELNEKFTPAPPDRNEKIGAFFIGLEMAGKTSIIKYFETSKIKTYIPTNALLITRIRTSKKKYDLVDCPGQKKLRYIWEEGLKLAKCLIFVLDISDKEKFTEAKRELDLILSKKTTNGMPLIITYHKLDLNIPMENYQMADSIFKQFNPSNKTFFIQTSINIEFTMYNLQNLILDLL